MKVCRLCAQMIFFAIYRLLLIIRAYRCPENSILRPRRFCGCRRNCSLFLSKNGSSRGRSWKSSFRPGVSRENFVTLWKFESLWNDVMQFLQKVLKTLPVVVQLHEAKALEKLTLQLLRRFRVVSKQVLLSRFTSTTNAFVDITLCCTILHVYLVLVQSILAIKWNLISTLSSSKCNKSDQVVLLCMLKQTKMDFSGNLCIRS